MPDPVVSVLLPVAPRARWLAEAVESVKRQTWESWNIVVVLDGPCAENADTLTHAGLDDRLTLIELPTRSGVASALNAGLQACTGEFVARIDADDQCLRQRLERQANEFRQRGSRLWVLGSSAILFDRMGREVGFRPAVTNSHRVRRRLAWRNALIHPSVMFRRQEILSLGGYNTETSRAEDYELWLRIARVAELDNLPQPLIQYRLHEGQHSRGPRAAQTAVIRAARRGIATSISGRVAADIRHGLWLTNQHFADWRRH